MPPEQPLTAPRTKTVKRLFAVSHNQCAFDACIRRLVDERGVVVGEICHIKGKAGGPRHDAAQSAEERHGFENLVLMCPEHHKAIDENPGEFTVAVLVALKRAHEESAMDVDVDAAADGLLVHSGFSEWVAQTAGDNGINVAATHSRVVVNTAASLLHDRRILAADVLWRAVVALRSNMPPFIGARLDIVTDAEYPAMLRDCQDMVALVDQAALARAHDRPAGDKVDDYLPFLSERLWDQFAAYRAFIGRVCQISLGRIGGGRHWTKDAPTMTALANAIGPERVSEVLALPAGRLNRVCSIVQADIGRAVRASFD